MIEDQTLLSPVHTDKFSLTSLICSCVRLARPVFEQGSLPIRNCQGKFGHVNRGSTKKLLRGCLRGSESALLVGLALFAEISPPSEIPCKICFRAP